jgi:oxalate decarboxylase
MPNSEPNKPSRPTVSRRNFVAAGSAGLAAAALWAGASAQEPTPPKHVRKASDPAQSNKPLEEENPNSNLPPSTDRGDLGPTWYSFNLVHKRVENGGWTRQVTIRELPLSTEIAGVNMRLEAGSFRELHWHTAAEWAYVLYGSARISVLNPDGTVFIDDIESGGLWYFPAGYPHSIQGLGPDGCEFLLVFDRGDFSEDNTFLLSEWVAHTPPGVLKKNLRIDSAALARMPKEELFIFPAPVPPALAEDRTSAGGAAAQSRTSYSFKMLDMAPTVAGAGGTVRIVDSQNFPSSRNIAAALVMLKPGGLRELHWHSTGSEWQFYLAGKGRMSVFAPPGRARTMDFNANDIGFVPTMAGHFIENIGDTDLIFLEILRTDRFVDFSLNNWLRHLPLQMVSAHLNVDAETIRSIPAEKLTVIA